MHSSSIWRGALAWNLLNLVVRINHVSLRSTLGACVFCHPPGQALHPSAGRKAVLAFPQISCGNFPAACYAIACGLLDLCISLPPSSQSTAWTGGWLSNAAE